MPKISVLMGTYNESVEYISAAVDSILNQTFSDFEFIIVLDNPDNSEIKALLEKYADKDGRIKLVYNEVNLGLAQSLNRGLKIATGAYIARMDADDIAFSTRLEKQLEYMERDPSCGVLGTNAVYIDENGEELKRPHPIVNDEKVFRKASMYANLIMHPTVMFRAEVVNGVGGYRDFKASQDYDLWLRLLKRNVKFVTLEETLLYYRIRRNSIGQSNAARQRANHLYAVYLFKHETVSRELFGEKNRDAFFEKIKLKKHEDQEKYNRAFKLYAESKIMISDKSIISGGLGVMRSLFMHREMFRTVCGGIKYKKIIRGNMSE